MQLRVLSLGRPQKIACALCFYYKRSISPNVKPNFKKNECNILAKYFNLRSMAVLSDALLRGEATKARATQSPLSFSALAQLGLFARPTKPAILRRLQTFLTHPCPKMVTGGVANDFLYC